MNDYQKISIITPVFNESQNLPEYLESLISQTYPIYEVLIIDDGSTDKSTSIINSFKDRLPIRIISSNRIGPAKARVLATRNISGEICVSFDADTVVERQCVEKLVEPFKDPEVGAVGGHIKAIGDTWTVRGAKVARTFTNTFKRDTQGNLVSLVAANMAFRISALRQLSNYEIEQPGSAMWLFDTSISLEIWKQGFKVVAAPEAIVYHREATDFISVFRRDLKFGKRAVWTFASHPRVILRWRYWIVYYPIALLILLPLLPYVSLILFFWTFVGALWLFRKHSVPLIDKIYAWIVLTTICVARSVGFSIEIIKQSTQFAFRR